MGESILTPEPPSPAQRATNALTLHGTVNVAVARDLHRAAIACVEQPGDVTVACSGLDHIDSAGVQIVLALKTGLEETGRTLRWVDVPVRLARLLFRTGCGQALGLPPVPADAEGEQTAGGAGEEDKSPASHDARERLAETNGSPVGVPGGQS